MGNVPTKLDDGSYQGDSRTNTSVSSSSNSNTSAASSGNRSRHASLVNAILNSGSGGAMGSPGHSRNVGPYARKSTREREEIKERHAKNLVVKYDENVDGGFMAPFGCYSFDKLDYDSGIVRGLIVNRKLAPFYTPLQDFDDSWSRMEIIKIVDGLPLHASFNENPEEFEDVPIGNLRKPNFDYLIDKSLPKKEKRRLHSKIFQARLYRKRMLWQEKANETFLEHKIEARKNTSKNKYLPSDDLKYELYKNGSECPICFLYVPGPLNLSKCCQQPICTECFVQIRRADPHFPHEEVDPTQPVTDDSEKDPNLLISEAANCPYCATPDFSITYQPPEGRRTGLGGEPPYKFTSQSQSAVENSEKHGVLTKESPLVEGDDLKPAKSVHVIMSDTIRPNWEVRLNKERMRLARRSANATAIHVSNRLIDPDYNNDGSGNGDSSPVGTNTSNRDRSDVTIEELENQMLNEAIRLSLEDKKHSSSRQRK
ncbi:Sip5p KNAG_0E02080 [Huiozyma naganishii CBS 8797]|uniref:Protein SIP5 n=1 Tax=Huiozyma naganishii (strain ATCC MYA-139 / BCRC 22969 / CBS 8797 / KCTC 17520 / NBRC 10181 / NCYC 3082 / Yp74L-3) TaxID=1071383 RepID=J7R6L2_HUIN7|nr:hypothetical protein KNAG_0E02080 [Kazachstania naganishii CBS 8797]CCK70470.1 hypothetical protein KNAG_0E02080 [Kazachstania naganishii CBS 8797]